MKATRILAGLVSVVALISFQGCAQLTKKTDSASQKSKDAEAERLTASDPVAAFARDGSVGSTKRITVNGVQYRVQLGAFYKSAAGTECRRITLFEQGSSQASAVCKVDGAWQTILAH